MKEKVWSSVSVYSPWWYPLKFSAQVTSSQEQQQQQKNLSIYLKERPLHRSACLKPCSAELTRPDLGGAWAGHVQELPPVEETNAANPGWEASSFQHGKCSAESWDFFSGKKTSCASKATQPTRFAARLMQPRIKCLLSSGIERVL